MTKPRTVAIAAGGTGGHMFAAQSLAEELLTQGWRVRLFTDPRGKRFTDQFPPEVAQQVIPSATFSRGTLWRRATTPWQIIRGIFVTARQLRREGPCVVVGFGGYPALPTMTAAWLLRKPTVIHEQNGVLGRVNRLFANRVAAVACGTWPMKLPRGIEGVHIGNPVRAAILARRGAPYIPPGPYPLSLLVFGGSQGASLFASVVPEAIAMLDGNLRDRLRTYHQAREEDVEQVKQTYERIGTRADVMPFITDMPARMSDAQLIISRAGASSLAEITTIGRPSILIPFAKATHDHQSANAQSLMLNGAAVAIAEAELTAARLAQEITAILTEPESATAIANAALEISKPDAIQRLVALIESVSP